MSVDQNLTAFIHAHVRSVWALELLLALRRDPSRCWPAEALVRELRASATLVADNLQAFERSGLAVRDETGCHRYAPASPLLDELCRDLEAAYRERPVAIINLIAKAGGSAVQSLADAFKFRGDGK